MKKNKYQPTIGLEIHIQLKTQSKMFCRCANNTWQIGRQQIKPNSSICPVCTGQPGALPMLNKRAVEMCILTGLALNCRFAKNTKFDRKNYFYPDLPKGYQISQYDKPICHQGQLNVGNQQIGITRIHLEEDTGKNIHPAGEDYSLIDYNRSGVPLMELVTEPHIHSASQAKLFCQKLQQILRALNVSNADMEKSQMRCEVNISISSSDQMGDKVEIKNLNSFKSIERSIEYEIMRQSKLLDQGQTVPTQTRGWHEKEQTTFAQRAKEAAHDYRYFPEPDIPQLNIDQKLIQNIKADMPELPDAKTQRFINQYGFKPIDAQHIIQNKIIAGFVENTMSELRLWLAQLDEIELSDDEAWEKHKAKLSKLTANWIINKLEAVLKDKSMTWQEMKITPENFAEFISLVYKNRVNSTNAVKLLQVMADKGGDPSQILEDQGMHLLEDVSDIDPVIDKIMQAHPDQVKAYQSGKHTLLKFFMGQVMRETQGKANPKMAEELLIQKLDQS